MLRQIGVEGIVSALHDVPNGEIWTEEAILDLKNYIEAADCVGRLLKVFRKRRNQKQCSQPRSTD